MQWIEAREKFEESLLLIDNRDLKTEIWRTFWASHQRFFKYLCIASKLNYAIDVAKQAIENGNCVVFGLQTTGHNRLENCIEKCSGDSSELKEFVSKAK